MRAVSFLRAQRECVPERSDRHPGTVRPGTAHRGTARPGTGNRAAGSYPGVGSCRGRVVARGRLGCRVRLASRTAGLTLRRAEQGRRLRSRLGGILLGRPLLGRLTRLRGSRDALRRTGTRRRLVRRERTRLGCVRLAGRRALSHRGADRLSEAEPSLSRHDSASGEMQRAPAARSGRGSLST